MNFIIRWTFVMAGTVISLVCASEAAVSKGSWSITRSGEIRCHSGQVRKVIALRRATWVREEMGALPKSTQAVLSLDDKESVVAEFDGKGSTIAAYGPSCALTWSKYYSGVELYRLAAFEGPNFFAVLAQPNLEGMEDFNYPGFIGLWDPNGNEIAHFEYSNLIGIDNGRLKVYAGRYGELPLGGAEYFFIDFQTGETHSFTWPRGESGGDIAVDGSGRLTITAVTGYKTSDGAVVPVADTDRLSNEQFLALLSKSTKVMHVIHEYNFGAKH